MRPIPFPIAVALLLLGGWATMATAQWIVPDFYLSYAYMPNLAPGQVPTLLVVPDGSGPGFDGARLPDGSFADATIRLVALDSGGVPYSGLPAERWWREWLDHGVDACRSSCCGDHPAGLFCDHATIANGSTEWRNPPQAGGQSETLVQVTYYGSPLMSNLGLRLRVNSPDLNGDRSVDLSDVPLFAADYAAGYRLRSDLCYDGVLNLSDIPVLARYMGCGCPQ